MKFYVRSMSNNKTKVLITRPEQSGQALAQQLSTQGIQSLCQPLFDYQPLLNSSTTKTFITSHTEAIVIFVSVAAVEFANLAYPLIHWQNSDFIAVGEKTQRALAKIDITAQAPEKQSSEGLLALPILTQVANKDIIIVRGDTGREYLAEQLQLHGAKVYYLASYQKLWRSFSTEIAQRWQKEEINCIVITSNAILERVLSLIGNSAAYWQSSCLWIVASERIKDRAIALGLSRVVNANGASDKAIITAIRQHGIL